MRKTVILANGDFPHECGVAWNILANAERVVACDGAADAYFARFHRPPTITVGDLDSFSGTTADSHDQTESPHSSQIIKIPEQDTNDLAKAVMVCRERGWERPVILGATGKRDDHTLGNIMRAFEFGLEIVTDYGCFTPIFDTARLSVKPGSSISVFAPDPATRATSRGLEWPLDNVKFQNLYCATLNRASDSVVEITADKTIFVYMPF